MGSGGSRSLWSPSKLVCWGLDQHQATGLRFFGLWPTLCRPVALEICNTHRVLFVFFVFFLLLYVSCYFMFLGNCFVFLLLLAIKLALGLFMQAL